MEMLAEIPDTPGVYRLDFYSGKSYVGMSSVSVRKRIAHHLALARIGKGWALHCAIRKYGSDSFSVDIVRAMDVATISEVAALEIDEISRCRREGVQLYNMTDGGEGAQGAKRSKETVEKMAAARAPHVESFVKATSTPEARAKMVEMQKQSWTKERRREASELRRGERAVSAVLKESDVIDIRARIDKGESCASISREYGVTPENISRIKHRRTWKHV